MGRVAGVIDDPPGFLMKSELREKSCKSRDESVLREKVTR